MKQVKWLLSIALLIALAASAVAFTSAENTEEATEWQADILKLMNAAAALISRATVIQP